MSTLGSLIVTLEANIAKFESDLGRAVTLADAAMGKISKAMAATGDAFKLLTAGFGIFKMVEFGSGVLHAAAELVGLRAQTGLSVEALSAMSNEATRAGVSIEDVATSFTRLEVNMGKAVNGNAKLENQFNAIGISSKQLAEDLINPDNMILDVANALEKFRDSANKTDIAVALLGKGGAKYLEFLHLMARDGLSAATATAEQAEKAKEFEVALANVSIKIKSFGLDVMTGFIPSVRVFTMTMAAMFDEMQIRIEEGSRILVLQVEKDLSELDSWIRSHSGSDAVRKFFGLTPHPAGPDFQKQMDDIRNAAQKRIDLNKKIAADEAMTLIAPGVTGPDNRPEAPLTAGDKPDKLSHINDGLIKALDERLKVLDAALKAEASAEKYMDIQLDSAYKHHTVTLADYGWRKAEILQSTFRRTEAIYEQEIEVTKSYISRIAAELSKEKGRKVDSTQTTQQASIIAAKQAELEQATAKLEAIMAKHEESGIQNKDAGIRKTEEVIKAGEDQAKAILDVDIAYATLTGQLALAQTLQDAATNSDKRAIFEKNGLTESTKRLNAESARNNQLALIAESKPIVDTNIAYLNLIGNTEEAVRLQNTMNDEMVRFDFTTRGATESLRQLDAIEKDRLLQASTRGWDGVLRAANAYSKNIQDVAAQTAAMTTKMLKSVEDGIVQFVHTGKLNWKSMIDAMIVDLIRLEVQKRIMGFISMGMNAIAGGAGAGAGTSASVAGDYGYGPGFGKAAGGPVNAGQQYIVGERGPEQFVPSVQGAIVPNGGGGGQSITYAPTIQIDSRSDRAQVQADTAQMMRQGNKELISMLVRYNPGLRL